MENADSIALSKLLSQFNIILLIKSGLPDSCKYEVAVFGGATYSRHGSQTKWQRRALAAPSHEDVQS